MPFSIDDARATAVRRFFGLLAHTKGFRAGQPFHLEKWQDDFVTRLICTVNEQGDRRYQRAFLAVPRKNGKTALIAGLGLYLLLADGAARPEIILAAASREQARHLFTAACEFLESSPTLSKMVRIYKNEVLAKSGGTLRTVAAEARTAHGLNPTAILADELHAWQGREFYDALQTSLGARPNPLLVMLTTAGADQTSLCREQWVYAEGVRDGTIDDASFLPCIYAAAPTDNPFSESTWLKANPNLGVSLSLDFIREQARRAQNEPGALGAFLTLHLNQWVSQRERWLAMSDWDACREAEPIDLNGCECFGGLDLAAMHDLSSLVLLFPVEGKLHARSFFWIPKDRMTERIRRDQVNYDVWLREGWLKTTEGNVISHDQIVSDITDLSRQYKIGGINFDRFGAVEISTRLTDMGLSIFPMGQGFASMGSPTSELARIIATRQLQHDGNPVLRWNAENVVVERDAAGNLKLSKSKARQKIDGMVALVMALDRAQRNRKVKSVYESRGVREVG